MAGVCDSNLKLLGLPDFLPKKQKKTSCQDLANSAESGFKHPTINQSKQLGTLPFTTTIMCI